MAKKLQFEVGIKDEASGGLAKISSNASRASDKMEKSFASASSQGASFSGTLIALNQGLELVKKGFNVLAGAAKLPIQAFDSIVSKSFDLVDTYDNQAKAIVSLGKAMESQGQFSRAALADLEEFASAQQELTNVGDELILKQQSLLGVFVGFGQPLKDATKAALDLAAATDGNVKGAFLKMIQAVETGSIMLGRATIKLTDSEDKSVRLSKAIEELDRRFGGMAQTIAQVGSGPIDALKASFGDLQESMGKSIANSAEFAVFIRESKKLVNGLAVFIEENLARVAGAVGKAFLASFTLAKASVDALLKAIALLATVVQSALSLIEELSFEFGGEKFGFMTEFEKQSRAAGSAVADMIDDLERVIENVHGIDAGIRQAVETQIGGLEKISAVIDTIRQTSDITQEKIDAIREANAGVGSFVEDPGVAAFADNLERVLNSSKSLREVLDDPTAITGSFDDLLGLLDDVTPQFDEFVAGMRRGIVDARATADGLTDVERALGKLKEGSESATAATVAQANQLRNMAQGSEDAKAAIKALDDALSEAGSKDDPFGKFVGSLEEIVPRAERFRQTIELLQNELSQGIDVGSTDQLQIAGQIEDAAAEGRAAFKKFGAGATFEVGRVLDLLQKMPESFLEGRPAVVAVVTQLTTLRDELEEIRSASKDALTNLVNPEAVTRLEQLRANLDTAVESGTSAAGVLSEFTDIVEGMSVAQILAAGEALDSGSQTADEFVESLRNLIDNANDAAAQIEGISKAAAKIDGKTITIDTKVRSQKGGAQSPEQAAVVIEDAISGAAERVTDAASNLDASADSAREAHGQAAAGLLEGGDILSAAGNGLADASMEVAASGAALDSAANDVSASATASQRSLESAAGNLDGAADAIERAASAGGNTSADTALIKSANALNSSAGRLSTAASSIISAANRLGKGGGSQLGNVVTAAQTRLVGEAGPELILPLNPRGASFLNQIVSQLGGRAGGGGTGELTVNVTGGTFFGVDDLARELEDAIATRLFDTSEVRA